MSINFVFHYLIDNNFLSYRLNELSIKENISFKVMYKGKQLIVTKLAHFVKHNYFNNKSGLIYCQSIEECISLAKELQDINVRNVCYLTNLSDDDKTWLRWINNYGVKIYFIVILYKITHKHKKICILCHFINL